MTVILQPGVLKNLSDYLPSLARYSQIVLIFHLKLKELYPSHLFAQLKKLNCLELAIPEGETSKTLSQAKKCWQKMISKKVDSQAAVLALGGGVVCDLAGFVASCYKRGLDTFYIPTTLLAMVDAALGGKTAVNLKEAKNAIGSFHHPQAVLIDPICLNSLPEREFNSGLAEIIKYGMIWDSALIEKLEQDFSSLKELSFLQKIIKRCVEIKTAIVSEDERDLIGKRAILNYGHTFGHAIESLTRYKSYLHGEAIAIGMSCAINLSAKLRLCDPSLIERQDSLCQRANLPINLPFLSISGLMQRIRSDKKSIYGKINLILLERIGKVLKICDVDSALIKQVLINKMN